ncbi:MAG TPA: VWA domain-containing protein, partial [bacterium]|nr:VWA domain-containing protein [bacterium]
MTPGGLSAADTSDSPDDPFDIGYSLRVSVSMVQVTATVRDRMGRTVHDLSQKDFEIYENGEKQQIVEFANARGMPKRILILLDVSGSMRIQNKIGVAKKGLRTLIGTLHEDDEVGLVFFADGDIEIASNYTKDRDIILNALGEVHAYGKTALRNAVRAAPALARVDDPYQRCMLLVTDGIDNASEVTMTEALDAARKVDLPIYAMGFDPYAGREVRPYEERMQAIESLKTLAN